MTTAARIAALGLTLAVSAGCASGRSQSAASTRPTGFPAACEPQEVEVMLLGVYHFASARDVIRNPTDDVLVPRRQAELEDLVVRLARWAPDQVAVEWPFDFADSTTARYRRFQAGQLSGSRNEVVQIGFRLAHRLQHATVFPIDTNLNMLNDSLEPLLERRPDIQQRRDSLRAVLQAQADSSHGWFQAATITEQLAAANTDRALHGGNSLGMFGGWLAAGEGRNYGGPLLLAKWYERNMLMVHHLTRWQTPATRRILVIVGSGHVPALRNILDEAPQFCPVSPLAYLQ